MIANEGPLDASFCFYRNHVAVCGKRTGTAGDGSFLMAGVQPIKRYTSQARGARGPRSLLTSGLFLFAVCVNSAAQRQKPCLPDKTFTRVGVLLEQQDYQTAKALLHELEFCSHLSPIQRFNVAWLYGKAHDSADALRIFKSVPVEVPDRLTHAYAIALAEFELAQYQASVDTLIALRSKGIFDAKCADLLGVSYSKLDKFQDAYDVMVENIRQNPSNPYAYFNLIALFVDTSEMDKAAQVANKAVAALPQNADALSMRGSIELSLNQTDDAYRDFSAAAQLSPQAPDPPFFMALVNYRQSKFDEAVRVLRDAVASGVADSDLHYMLAECLLRIGSRNLAAVLAELSLAIQLNSNSVPARSLRGATLLEVGRPQDAVADLKLARELDPNPQRDARNTTYLLGRAYAALGRRDEANALFAQVGHQYSFDKTDTLNQLSEQKMRTALHP
jgi:tetratricopeptide (TPR) repeat protein